MQSRRSGRFSRGWQLTKDSWAVVRADRSLVAFPIVSVARHPVRRGRALPADRDRDLLRGGAERVRGPSLEGHDTSVGLIALEGVGPKEAITRSTGIIRERWGEGVTGSFAIGGVVFLLGLLPAGVLIFLGVMAADSSGGLAAALIVVGAVILVVALLLQATIMAVFKVALFRFATDGRVLGGFEQGELEAAFVAKRR